jgi:hypothetical protein
MGQNLNDVRSRQRVSLRVQMYFFLSKIRLSLHLLDFSGVMIDTEFTALTHKEGRRGERV